jgi:hypothetical protein
MSLGGALTGFAFRVARYAAGPRGITPGAEVARGPNVMRGRYLGFVITGYVVAMLRGLARMCAALQRNMTT